MTKIKHPSNRYERLRIKEIKDEKTTGQPSGLRRRAREAEEARELEHELREVALRQEGF